MDSSNRIAGIELGGTKSIAVLAQGADMLEKFTIATTTPAGTLGQLRDVLHRWNAERALDSVGIASFGPLQLAPDKPGFGTMLKTPKPHWSGAAVAGDLIGALSCPWSIDTDVNGAGLAEYRWGAGAGCRSLIYITIGTGLGGGLIVDGRAVHGAMHPEIGHIRIRRASGDGFAGVCPFHGDCAEGLVSGPALAARFGQPADTVDESHPLWRQVAGEIAELACTLLLTASPERILVGGGVATARPVLLDSVRDQVVERLAGYLPFVTRDTVKDIICAPALGHDAGPRGALALALDALGR
ncbi:MAG: ROK family protein [Acidobacteria bacterium]|nr:ROK family protein [Acidobacteriota bacterium]